MNHTTNDGAKRGNNKKRIRPKNARNTAKTYYHNLVRIAVKNNLRQPNVTSHAAPKNKTLTTQDTSKNATTKTKHILPKDGAKRQETKPHSTKECANRREKKNKHVLPKSAAKRQDKKRMTRSVPNKTAICKIPDGEGGVLVALTAYGLCLNAPCGGDYFLHSRLTANSLKCYGNPHECGAPCGGGLTSCTHGLPRALPRGVGGSKCPSTVCNNFPPY